MVVSRGIYPWIMCFWNPMLLIRAKFANGHIHYQLSHFQNYFPFFFFQFLSSFYLMVPKMHLMAHSFQNFLGEKPGQCACGKVLLACFSHLYLLVHRIKILGAKSLLSENVEVNPCRFSMGWLLVATRVHNELFHC